MPKAAIKATFTDLDVRGLFNTKQTSLWEEGVEYLCSQHRIESYIRFLTASVEEADKWVAEFSALVDYLGRKRQFCRYGYCFIGAIEIIVNYHRRRGAEAIITQ